MRTDDSKNAEGLIFKSLDKAEGPVDPDRSEAARRAWESRDRGAGGDKPEAPAGGSLHDNLGKLQHGEKHPLPGLKSGKDVLQGYTATYVGDQKGNRTYRVLDPHGRFAWNLSHKRIMAAVADKDFQATDLEKVDDFSEIISRLGKQDDSGEVKACVKRKIPIIAGENPEWEQNQVVAVAFSMCREENGEKSLGEALIPPWVHNKALRVRDDSRP